MAKFKLALVTQDEINNQIVELEDFFTDFSSNFYTSNDQSSFSKVKLTERTWSTGYWVKSDLGEYIKDTYPSFIPGKDYYQKSSYAKNYEYRSHSMDENFSESKNSQRMLSFSMLKYEDGELNPYAAAIAVGSKIRLYDKYDNIHNFTVKNITYSLTNQNVQYKYTCQDTFTYQAIRQNSNYQIDNDPSSEDFIGAKSIDWWANKIVTECHVPYIYRATDSNIIETDSTNALIKLYREPLPEGYNPNITFSISGSNAANALIALGEQAGLILYVDDKHKWVYFIPEKKEDFNGLYFSPAVDIQNFAVEEKGDTLTTLLNVTGQTIDDSPVTMIPTVPNFFLQYFNSSDWENSEYVPGFFTNLIQEKDKVIPLSSLDYESGYENSYWIFSQNGSEAILTTKRDIKIPFGYTGVSLKKGQQIVSYVKCNNGAGIYSGDDGLTAFFVYNGNDIDISHANEETLYNICGQEGKLKIKFTSSLSVTSCEVFIYLRFLRQASYEEQIFAEMADNLPWLENKIIDPKYFLDHKIITKNQYKGLNKVLKDDLRKVNGKILYWANAYYNSLAEKIRIESEILSKIDVYGAELQASIINKIINISSLEEIDLGDLNSYQDAYWTLMANNDYYALNSNSVDNEFKKTPILDFCKLISYYANLTMRSEQRFLENIYKFEEFFNQKADFDGEITTNGNYYLKNYTETEDPNKILKCANIASQLEGYWNNAYLASLGGQYFLIKDMLAKDSNDQYFNFKLVDEQNENSPWEIDHKWVCSVTRYKIEENNIVITKFPDYNIVFDKRDDYTGDGTDIILSPIEKTLEQFSRKGDAYQWFIEPQSVDKQYYIIPNVESNFWFKKDFNLYPLEVEGGEILLKDYQNKDLSCSLSKVWNKQLPPVQRYTSKTVRNFEVNKRYKSGQDFYRAMAEIGGFIQRSESAGSTNLNTYVTEWDSSKKYVIEATGSSGCTFNNYFEFNDSSNKENYLSECLLESLPVSFRYTGSSKINLNGVLSGDETPFNTILPGSYFSYRQDNTFSILSGETRGFYYNLNSILGDSSQQIKPLRDFPDISESWGVYWTPPFYDNNDYKPYLFDAMQGYFSKYLTGEGADKTGLYFCGFVFNKEDNNPITLSLQDIYNIKVSKFNFIQPQFVSRVNESSSSPKNYNIVNSGTYYIYPYIEIAEDHLFYRLYNFRWEIDSNGPKINSVQVAQDDFANFDKYFKKGDPRKYSFKYDGPINILNGTYSTMVQHLIDFYRPIDFSPYNNYVAQHDRIWDSLYETYAPFLLEQQYTNEEATSSQELYKAALNFYKDQSIPERGYTLSIIDLATLKGYKGQEIHIGDQIRLASQEFYTDQDNLKDALIQPLFVTDVSYNLRKDSDINITVNLIKYSDKVIDRLISLIK